MTNQAPAPQKSEEVMSEREVWAVLDRARQLASRAYDWDLGTDGQIQMDDGSWVSCYDLMREFERALKELERTIASAATAPKKAKARKS